MAPTKTVKVQVIRRLDLKPEPIYDAFLYPAKAGKFMFATPTGKMIKSEVQPAVGGSFCFIDRRPNGDAEHYGVFTELVRPKRIAFKFAVQKDAPSMDQVVIDITMRGGRSEIALTHEIDAKFASVKDKVAEGWTSILSGLTETLASS